MKKISPTELNNPNTENIDIADTFSIVKLINNEDMKVALEVQKSLKEIAEAVDIISDNFLKGGRLFYFGAGTSGRLGILDASECPPTFSTPNGMVQGIIAGGDTAIKNAVEGAEDSIELAQKDFNSLNITTNDTVVVISASGNADYAFEILKLAALNGIKSISLTSNPEAKIKENTNCCICIKTGAEAVTGSTRMKAGTAQKMVLNMLTTASMIKIGKVYKNYMIDVNPTNQKLQKRAVRIVSDISNADEALSAAVLSENGFKIKHAILKIKYSLNFEDAERLIKKHNGILRKIFMELDKNL